MRVDLHMHSYYSDGEWSPYKIVKKCKELGLEIISLTDHENVGGIPEAIKTGKELGIKVIPGIELTCNHKGDEEHFLGYFIDCQSHLLRSFLDYWRETKISQIKKIIENLQGFGFEISLEKALVTSRGFVDRPHIVGALYQNPRNSAILDRWGIKTKRDFFKKFLLEKPSGEGLAYEKRETPAAIEAINLIKKAGGLAIWAHPCWREHTLKEIRLKALIFKNLGLDGLEVYYSVHNEEQALALHQITQTLLMIESGGSDSHQFQGDTRTLGNFQTFGREINFPFDWGTEGGKDEI